MYLSREIYLKELAHVIVELDKSKICKVGWQAGDPGKNCNLSLKTVCWQNFFFFGGSSVFFC